jgi:hypothetical protein
MTQVVAIMPGGQLFAGEYDGYGQVGTAEDAVGWDSTVWHKACWIAAGSPTDYQGASDHAPDQGYFFDEGEHDLPEPRKAQTSDLSGHAARLRGELGKAISLAQEAASSLKRLDDIGASVEATGSTHDADLMPDLLVETRSALTELHRAVVLDSYVRRTVERLAQGRG